MQTYHYDLRGSTIALTDAKGKVTDTYGEELSHDGTTNQPFQYDGRDGVQTDPNGLYQMRSRYYNPEIRRFVNRDVVTGTIADGLTMNRYAYVNGNPVSYVDPFGLSAEHSDLMRTGFSMALDAVPFVGTVKGIQEVLTGTDLITGQHLSVADRVAEGAGTLLSFLPDGKLLGTFAAKEAIDGGEWAWKQVGKEAVNEVGSLDFIDETGRLGGKLYSEKDLRMLGSYLQKRGVTLKVGDEFLPPGKGGAFNATNSVLYLRDNPTQYEVWHELSHYLQYKKIGREAYLSLPRTQGRVPYNDLTQFNAPEQFVFDLLSNSDKRWTMLNENERQHAIDYILDFGGIR